METGLGKIKKLFHKKTIIKKKMDSRSLHRDLAYFYLGLIISFALSGIFLNHRKYWHPARYTYKSEQVSTILPKNLNEIDEKFVKNLSKQWNLEDKFKGFRIENGELKITYQDDRIELKLETGKGRRETYIKTPLLGQMTQLHQDTSTYWIYYSDIFGVAMIVIAFTGMFIAKGKFSFAKRGWKLALIGIIFPLIFLFLLSCQSKNAQSNPNKCVYCGMNTKKKVEWTGKIKTQKEEKSTCSPRCLLLIALKENDKDAKYFLKDYYKQNEINAKEAFFVTGSKILGPMGNDFIPFAKKEDAETFLKENEGKNIFTFNNISLTTIKENL
jgi:hypothetical protein